MKQKPTWMFHYLKQLREREKAVARAQAIRRQLDRIAATLKKQ